MNGYNSMGVRDGMSNPADERITDQPIWHYDCDQCSPTVSADIHDEYHMKDLCNDCCEFLWNDRLEKAVKSLGVTDEQWEDAKIDTVVDKRDDTLEGFQVIIQSDLGPISLDLIPANVLWTKVK